MAGGNGLQKNLRYDLIYWKLTFNLTAAVPRQFTPRVVTSKYAALLVNFKASHESGLTTDPLAMRVGICKELLSVPTDNPGMGLNALAFCTDGIPVFPNGSGSAVSIYSVLFGDASFSQDLEAGTITGFPQSSIASGTNDLSGVPMVGDLFGGAAYKRMFIRCPSIFSPPMRVIFESLSPTTIVVSDMEVIGVLKQ